MSQNTTSSEQEPVADSEGNISWISISDIDDNNEGEDIKLNQSQSITQADIQRQSEKNAEAHNKMKAYKATYIYEKESFDAKELKKLEAMNRINADYYDRMDKHNYKKKGFVFILICLASYLVIVVGDSLLQTFCEVKISSYADGFIELLKYIISTLIGFVFADTRSKNDKKKKKE